MPFVVEAGPVKRLHMFTTRLRDNRNVPPDYRDTRVWVVWVGSDKGKAIPYVAATVVLDGPATAVYAPDEPIRRALCGAETCVEAWVETAARLVFTTADTDNEGFAFRHYSDAKLAPE